MRFDIITIFPAIFDSYFNESILKRAQESGAIEIYSHDLRAGTTDKHRTVDDKPYGGNPGMILKVEPVVRALRSLPVLPKRRIVLFDPAGAQFRQARARRYTKLDQLILICGRYEGFDERVKDYVDDIVSIGPYVLSGGELAAMVIVEAVGRLQKGVLGNVESLNEESYSSEGYVEYPQYTRPEVFEGRAVPQVLLSGNHKKIAAWQKVHSRKPSVQR
ncbi:tRNA (guanosine(37)-N1)-methyltransferase TrmD [Candidatus Uhrbacteria bacterium]|nr:tRNA (guanosine(37)-N1)-methyltransferase TrmD [Candidatus Uhrbacteria bacterium]